MLKSFRGLSNWHYKDCKAIYRRWRWRIVKQDEMDGDPEFTMTIDLEANQQVIERQIKKQS